MLSRGYFRITKELLKELLKEYGLKYTKNFIWEMFCCGGRISYAEYDYWFNFLNKEVRNEG